MVTWIGWGMEIGWDRMQAGGTGWRRMGWDGTGVRWAGIGWEEERFNHGTTPRARATAHLMEYDTVAVLVDAPVPTLDRRVEPSLGI